MCQRWIIAPAQYYEIYISSYDVGVTRCFLVHIENFAGTSSTILPTFIIYTSTSTGRVAYLGHYYAYANASSDVLSTLQCITSMPDIKIDGRYKTTKAKRDTLDFLQWAERTRFELVDRIAPVVGLANRWFQPLTHLSIGGYLRLQS